MGVESKGIFHHRIFSFVFRFSVVHVATYTTVGILFMFISDYFTYFRDDPIFHQVMKPSDALTVRLAVPIQFLRGALLALAIYPFREVILEKPRGWIKLFWLLFVLSSIGAVITGPGSIEGILYTFFEFNPIIGYPEIVIQMLTFSYLFVLWQKHTKTKP